MNRKLIGINGFARSGKDTFFERCNLHLSKEGIKSHRIAFADALKEELDPLLKSTTNISAFTEDNVDKELIRPLLVTYGTEIRRKLNPNCWIEKVQPKVIEYLNKNEFVFVTDVRFENEARWIKMNGGIMIHIDRLGILPANHEEHKQKVLMKKHFDYKIAWPTFGEENLESCDEFIIPNLSLIIKRCKDHQQKFEEVF